MSATNYDVDNGKYERQGVLTQENAKYIDIYKKIVNRFDSSEDKVIAILKNYTGGMITMCFHPRRHYSSLLKGYLKAYENMYITLIDVLNAVSKMAKESNNNPSSSLVRRLAYIEQFIAPSPDPDLEIFTENKNQN